MTKVTDAFLPPFWISTPMPLAGHDANVEQLQRENEISTPMPLAGHDKVA